MASKRCINTLTRHCSYRLTSKASLQTLTSLPALQPISDPARPLHNHTTNPNHFRRDFQTISCIQPRSIRSFSSQRRRPGYKSGEEEEEDEEDEDGDGEDEDEEGELSDSDGEEGDNGVPVANHVIQRTYSVEEKEQEAAAIGYKVIGPLDPSEKPFKPYEPVFAVVQIGSHQFKVSNGDAIYTEKLKFCEVNDKLILSKVLMVGSQTQTIIGRPILPDATVHAIVEEHALDAKVIIFKKKRRKNYRRTKGHRQELTKLRITDILGVEKPAVQQVDKPEKEALAA